MPILPRSSKTLRKRALGAALGFLIAASAIRASAAVVLDLRDGASATAKISIKDPTRIRVEGAFITDIVGSSIITEKNPGGTLSVSGDAQKGDVYLQPVDPKLAATSVFVATEHATYTLVLVPADIPADTLVIRDRRAAAASETTRAPGRLPNHEKSLITLLKAIAADQVPPEFRVIERNTPVVLWQEARFTLIRRYEGHPRWSVDAYLLTNISAAPMVLDEREFLTRGVAAVALDQADLAPGQSTVVRIVREAGENAE